VLNSNKVLRKFGFAGQCLTYAGFFARDGAVLQEDPSPETALQKRK
jgi:hypothetical protein